MIVTPVAMIRDDHRHFFRQYRARCEIGRAGYRTLQGPKKVRYRLQGNDMDTIWLCTARGALALLTLAVASLLFAGAYCLEGRNDAPQTRAP
jgi:hypothetical protein